MVSIAYPQKDYSRMSSTAKTTLSTRSDLLRLVLLLLWGVNNSQACLSSALDGLSLSKSKLIDIPSLGLQIFSEFDILGGDSVLTNVWQAQRQDTGDNAKSTGHIERVLSRETCVVATSLRNVLEDICASEGTNFPNSCSNCIVFSSNTSGRCFGGKETNIVARSNFSQGQEDAVDNAEAGDVGWFCQSIVKACHQKPDTALDELQLMLAVSGFRGRFTYHTTCKGISRANPIRIDRAKHCAGDIKQVDDGVPAEHCCERCCRAVDVSEDGRRKNTERVGGELW